MTFFTLSFGLEVVLASSLLKMSQDEHSSQYCRTVPLTSNATKLYETPDERTSVKP